MKSFEIVLSTAFSLLAICVFSQENGAKQNEKNQHKVNIFTSEEKDALQNFYADEVNKMKMSDEKEEEYYNILLYHTYSMSRLDDKDKGYSENEITKKFNILQGKMNTKMKALLSQEQYVIHLETFSKILYSVNRKRNLRNN